MSRYLAERVETSPRISLAQQTRCAARRGRSARSGAAHDLHTDEAAGRDDSPVRADRCGPPHQLAPGTDPADAKGFALTGPAADSHDGTFETRRQGVFAVGDVRSGSVKRVASAVGEGSVVIRQVHDYLAAGDAGERPPPAKNLRNQEEHMTTYKVGYFVGSLSSTSINRILSKALIRVAPDDLEFSDIPIGNLPLYSPDFDNDYPPKPKALKASIAAVDAVLFVTPEYNRSIPGALKNAIDWASRPWRELLHHIPAAVIGASIGQIGTAMGQQSLRGVLIFCNARHDRPRPTSSTPPMSSRTTARSPTTPLGLLRAYMAECRTPQPARSWFAQPQPDRVPTPTPAEPSLAMRGMRLCGLQRATR